MGLKTGAATLEIIMETSQMTKIKSTLYPSYTTSWTMPKGLEIMLQDTCSAMFIIDRSSWLHLQSAELQTTHSS